MEFGRRVKVEGTFSSTWTVSIHSGMDVIYEKDPTGAVTKYVYANGMRIAKITPSGTFQYYLGDHLGSTRKLLDGSRNTVFSAEYEPFGKPYAVTGSESYKFTGEKHDDPTGLVYLRARQYDPDLGRFVSADPILGSPLRPQTLNRYAYVANNPLRFVDPTGRFLENIDWASVGALLAGAAVMAAAVALCATGVGCIGVIAAFILAGAAGAGTAIAITSAQGRPVGLDTVVNGAAMGLTGGAIVYGAAAAGFFGPGAAEATSSMEAITAGTLAAISDAAVGREEPTAKSPVFEDPIGADPPSLGSRIGNPKTSQTARQVDFVTGYVDEHGAAPAGYEGGGVYKNVGPGFLPNKQPDVFTIESGIYIRMYLAGVAKNG